MIDTIMNTSSEDVEVWLSFFCGAITSISRYMESSSVVPFVREMSSLLGPNGYSEAVAVMVAVMFWYEFPPRSVMLVVLSSTVIPSGSCPANRRVADPASVP